MIIRLPSKSSPRWSGPYLGNYEGLLYRTFNVDLDRSSGHIGVSMAFRVAGDTSDTNLRNLGTIDNFTRTNADGVDRWWGLNRGGRLIKTDSNFPLALSLASWDEDALDSNTPTDAVDMTVHENDSDSASGENKLFVTRAGDIAVLNDTASNAWNKTWWTTTKGQVALKGSTPHPIEYFPFQRISIIGDGNLIHTIDKTGAVSYARVVIPTNLEVWGIITTPSRAWMLCGGKQGSNGAIVEWDGFSQTYNAIHDGQSSHVMAGVNYFGIPIVVNSRGLIMEYNGSSFQPMIRGGQKICFPSYEESDNGPLFPNYSTGVMHMVPRGMAVTEDGLIHINIGGPFFASQKQMAGVWCLNPAIGRLYLKHSFATGTQIDYGHQYLTTIGAIKATGVEAGSGFSLLQAAYLLGGAKISRNYTASVSNIWMLARSRSGETERRGHFITQYITAEEIKEQWDSIWLEITPFKTASVDKIIVKARAVDPLIDRNAIPLEATITWTSTTTFTVDLTPTDDEILVGDEIEVMTGSNAGVLAHITEITGAYGVVQTMTIDETVTTGSGNSLCRFERWKKLGVISSSAKYTIPLKIGITSSFIQFKIEMRGLPKDYQIKNLYISTVKQTKAKK